MIHTSFLNTAFLCLLIAFSCPLFADPIIHLDTGIAKGVVQQGGEQQNAAQQNVEQFLGLPYAAAPVGDLRWAAPRKPALWKGTRDASILSSRCPQSQKGLADGSDSEDCLYLNIYRPAQTAKTPRAIYLYIHGGGAVAGSANDMDGSELARQGDIIVININYRLGALGFMNSEAIARTAADGKAGNYALQDVQAALEWVARNAQALGGDAKKITLGGESAGGTILCPLITSPQTRPLFRSAIISSDDCLRDIDSLAQARERAKSLAQKLHCDTDKNAADCLRNKTPAELLSAGGFAAPTAEPEPAFTLIEQKQWQPMPILVGANREEGRIAGPAFQHFDREKLQRWLAALVPAGDTGKILKLYGNRYTNEQFPYPYIVSDIITDSGMRGFGGCSSVQLAKNIAQQASVYFYEFADPHPPFPAASFDFKFGSPHSAEIPYLWPGASQPRSEQFTPEQKQLSQQMIRYWANFIKSGNPNGKGLPQWRALAKAQQYMELQPAGSREKAVKDFERYHRCDLWYSMPWIMARGEP